MIHDYGIDGTTENEREVNSFLILIILKLFLVILKCDNQTKRLKNKLVIYFYYYETKRPKKRHPKFPNMGCRETPRGPEDPSTNVVYKCELSVLMDEVKHNYLYNYLTRTKFNIFTISMLFIWNELQKK
jgi:hypothetical protein